MPAQTLVSKGNPAARHEITPSSMAVILVTGSYDHEIRFWEAWSGICSRTIARTGEAGVSGSFREFSDPHRTLQQVNRLAISPE
jgi:G protein beta subunit-like protein